MHTYTPKKFDLPAIPGISEKQIAVHLALYEGYVKHVNLIAEKLSEARAGTITLDPYISAELRRRFAFEFDGMRMHEYFFEQFEGGPTGLTTDSKLATLVTEKYGSTEKFIEHIKEVATTRGIGWVVVYRDDRAETVHAVFVADHEIGQLSGLTILAAFDLWEHAFMVDYVPAEKKNYLEAVLGATNWSVCERRAEA
jgi:Fe-Mn family superoxide dismutase